MGDPDYFSQSRYNDRGEHCGSSLDRTSASGLDFSQSRTRDSWIEVPSRPSSSSPSSAHDEIVTTGLYIEQDISDGRRRRLQRGTPLKPSNNIHARFHNAGDSSQDEYEESESESDRVMTSSNEGLIHSALPAAPLITQHIPFSSDNDDENTTALATDVFTTEQCFTPQPNAFSHPPSSHSLRSQLSPPSPTPEPAHLAPPIQPRTLSHRHSYPAQVQHTPYTALSPSHHVDHDAALRASLSTLLSCAAAARGLPKSSSGNTTRPSAGGRMEPLTLRIVPESVVLGEDGVGTTPNEQQQERRGSSASSPSVGFREATVSTHGPVDKGKRKAGRSTSKERRAAKKLRHGSSSSTTDDGATISPTLLTWVVSAGVLVVVSALSFSAGYAMGRETGRFEGIGWASSGADDTRGCAREILGRGSGSGLGLRRLRWRDAAEAVGVRV